MKRGDARELAVHLIYGRAFTGEEPEQVVSTRLDKEYYGKLAEENEVYAQRPDRFQLRYIDSVVTGVANREDELDDVIRQFSIGWDISRISKLARCILRLAIYEILYVDDVPTGRCGSRSGAHCEKIRRRRYRRVYQRNLRQLCPQPEHGDGSHSRGSKMSVIGIDTSNYTTSIAFFDGEGGENCSRLLPVRQGELGLRQSDAVFAHIKSLPELSGRLFSHIQKDAITAVGVSTRPRAVEGSYMPCFMVGYSHAKLLSDALGVPLAEVSHQQGHVAASLWSAGRLDLLEKTHLAWHLSGGTTELLLVEPEGRNVKCTRIGGTTDISAGQLIDRTGQLLELPFPSGKHLDSLSREATGKDVFRVKCRNSEFSLSGVQNKVQQFHAASADPAETAAYALRCVAGAVYQATVQALEAYPGLSVVFSGGVASNSMLRELTRARFIPFLHSRSFPRTTPWASPC